MLFRALTAATYSQKIGKLNCDRIAQLWALTRCGCNGVGKMVQKNITRAK